MLTKDIAEAFSGHRFAETYEHLADDVRWVLPGLATIEGKRAVIQACESSAAEMDQLASAEFSRFVSVADDHVAAIDTIGRYVDADGSVSVVSSADVFEFDGDANVTTITSYAVELEASAESSPRG
jgi:hypothetical protein